MLSRMWKRQAKIQFAVGRVPLSGWCRAFLIKVSWRGVTLVQCIYIWETCSVCQSLQNISYAWSEHLDVKNVSTCNCQHSLYSISLAFFYPNILTISSYFLQDADVDQGNSVHGAAEGGIKKAQIQQCMRVLRSVMSLGEEAVSQDLCDQGIINQLLGKLNWSLTYLLAETCSIKKISVQYISSCCVLSGILVQMEANPDEDDAVSVKIKSDIQLILSVLCDSDMHRKVKLSLLLPEQFLSAASNDCDCQNKKKWTFKI